MQYKIAKILNTLLVVILVAVIGIWCLYFFYLQKVFAESKTILLVSIFIIDMLLMLFFKWLESTWDKRVIMKMVQQGFIALADIKGGERVMPMRDSSFTNYWLYSFKADIYDRDGYVFEKTFYEKMNREFSAVPQGMVYVTYDDTKPNQIFIVPNVMISRVPSLQPIVNKFESNPKIKIKYLDAYYNKGIVLKTIRQSVREQREILRERNK